MYMAITCVCVIVWPVGCSVTWLWWLARRLMRIGSARVEVKSGRVVPTVGLFMSASGAWYAGVRYLAWLNEPTAYAVYGGQIGYSVVVASALVVGGMVIWRNPLRGAPVLIVVTSVMVYGVSMWMGEGVALLVLDALGGKM